VLPVPKRVRWFLRNRHKAVSPVLRISLRAAETVLRLARRRPLRGRGLRPLLRRLAQWLRDFHCLLTDGEFALARDSEAPFHAAVDMSNYDVVRVQAQVRRRVLRWLVRHSYLEDATVAEMFAWRRSRGFSLDASVRLATWYQQGLERLALYCARPSFSSARLDRIFWGQ